MQTFIDLITATFAAGETKIFEMSGSYLEVIDAPYPVTVELSDRYGGLAGKMTNAEASFFIASDYSRITLTSATAQTIRFGYGSGTVGNRKTAGVVSIIDGEKARTLSGGSFFATPATGAVVSQFSFTQLWNPAGSGKNLIVQQLAMASPTAGQINLHSGTVAYTTDITATNAGNKRIGSAMGIATIRSQTSVTGVTTSLKLFNIQASTELTWKPAGSLVVPPGFGINAQHQVANASLASTFEWFEENV